MLSILCGTTITSDEDVTVSRRHSGGEYHDVSTSDAVSFHPYLTTDSASSGYQGMVYAGGLLRLDENTVDYIPNMAESHSISGDGLTFTFHLRQDLQWSDGQPMSAHDFEWTYTQAKNPDNSFPYLSQLDFIKSYKALDAYTLEVKIDKIYTPAYGIGSPGIEALLADNPFPETPPRFIRAMIYDYHFTTWADGSGDWWRRELIGPYAPVLSLEAK